MAALGVLASAQEAHAANTWTVDDDGAQCPAAQFTTVQNAIFAARSGDTVVICPGTYVEGGGGVGSNAIIIRQNVTIRGAGADVVTIKPRRTTPVGSRIAETSSPSIRNNIGAIVMIDGDYVPTAISPDTQTYAKNKSALVKVDISGVTIDGDGVYAEAGIVFRDAEGSVSNSRITNIVTTERSMDTPRAGEYKGSNDGFGIASVTSPPFTTAGVADSPPLPGTPRHITIDHTRVDRYNSAGVLLDGATGDTLPLTAAPAWTVGTLVADQIAGRTLCIDFESNGNCSNPQPATNGPLYGQDGVRITARSTAALTNNTITQNLVQGTGAPVRGAATNNASLWMGAAVRLIGGGTGSVFARNNFTDNAYGVYNAQLDGATANTAAPVKAEDNWWGLRTSALATNPGPAISPTTNPPAPENPVNGTATADGTGTTSDAVDFFPFRNGFQSDPNTGEFPNVDVPGPVKDLAPTITLKADKATYHRGDTATLTASPDDDFGVSSVTFYDGAAIVGTITRKPYVLKYKIPTDVLCSGRTLTAMATDSSGQSGSSSVTAAIDPTDCNPLPGPSAPTISFVDAPRRIDAKGATIATTPVASAGVSKVQYYLGTALRCTAAASPWSCRIVPTGADVGVQVLRAVVTDATGHTGEASVRVEIPRFSVKGIRLSIDSRNQSGDRVRKTVSGELRLPANVTAAQGCSSGHVTVVIKRAGKIVSDEQEKLSKTCKFSSSVVTNRTRKAKHFSVNARFGGNDVLLPATATRRFS